MATRKCSLKNQSERIIEHSSVILFEQLEQRILLNSDISLLAGEIFGDDQVSVPAVSSPASPSEISLGLSIDDVLVEWRALFPDQFFVVWEKESPWDNLDRIQSPPEGVTGLQDISLDIGRNEYESTSFVVTNLAGMPFTFNFNSEPGDLSITLRKGIWVTAMDGTMVNDALSLIDNGQVVIPSGESVEIWVTLNGNDVAPGQYIQTIQVGPPFIIPSTLEIWEVDISVTVHDISLPEVLPINTAYWDYVSPSSSPDVIDAKLTDLKSHYVNTAVVHPSHVPRFFVSGGTGELLTNYTDFDNTMDMYEAGLAPKTYIFEMLSSIYFEPSSGSGMPGSNYRPDFMTEEWQNLFEEWLTGWVAHMESRGIGYDDYYVHPYDERLGDNVRAVSQLIKEIDPNVRLVANSVGSTTEIANIAPYIDVWMPLLAHWLPIGGVTGGMSQTVQLSPNTQYTFSFYGKIDTSTTYWNMIFGGSTPNHTEILGATNWTQTSHSFTTASNTTYVTINFYPMVGDGSILIDDVYLGNGVNLISNGGMESGNPPTGWSANSATITADTTDPYSGSKAAKVTGIPRTSNPGKEAVKELVFLDSTNLFTSGDMESGGSPTTLPDGWYGSGPAGGVLGISSDTPYNGGTQSLSINANALFSAFAQTWSEQVTEFTDYELSFWHKGDVYTSSPYATGATEFFEGTDEWKKETLIVKTGQGVTTLNIIFYDYDFEDGLPLLIDNVVLKEQGKALWTYANPQGVIPSKADPYKYYRAAIWHAWDEGMTGFGYWIYSYREAWDYSSPSAHPEGGYSVVYNSAKMDTPPEVSSQELIVPGKRWEATREGMEDYTYLHMLQSMIDDTPLPPTSSVVQDAKDTLAYWVETVLGNQDVDYASQAKVDIIAAILAFTPTHIPGDANGDGQVSAGDYSSVQANFGNTGAPYIPGDANGDGMVSAGDYSSVQANFGNTAVAPVVATTAVSSESALTAHNEVPLGIAIDDILIEWRALFPGQDYVVWEKDSPWDNLGRVTGPPNGVTELQNISLDIGRNEYESTSFVVTNLAETSLTFNFSSDPDELLITLRKGIWVTAKDGTKVNDALSLIDGGQVTIASGESLEIWVTLNGNDVAAGLYEPTVSITSASLPSHAVDISVTVHNVSLPEVLPINTYYWDYVVPGWTSQELIDEKLADLKSHHVNTATVHPYIIPRYGFDNGTGELIADYTLFDEAMDMYESGLAPSTYNFELLFDIYFESTSLIDYPSASRPTFLSTAWKDGFRDWLTGWVAHMESRGMGYDDYFVHPYDEQLGANVYEIAKLIKETDPNVRVVTNAIGSVQEINNIAPYVDVWMPLLNSWLSIGGVTGAMSQTVLLSPNTQYTFSFYGKNGDCTIYWDLNFNGSTSRRAFILGSADWAQGTLTFTTAPDTTQVFFRFFPTVGNGTIFIDDVYLGNGVNLVTNGDMELGDPPSGWSTYSATIAANTADPHSGSQSAEVTSIPQETNPGKDAIQALISADPSNALWTYANPQGVLPSLANPYRYYRSAVWEAWNEGMTGFGYWIYSYRDVWDYSAPGAPGEGGYAVVYRSNLPDTPPEVSTQEIIVPSKRWEATREGVEDYTYLHMLQSLIEDAPLPPDSSLILDAKNTLANWVETVLDDQEVDYASQAKVDIIAAILALTPNLLLGDANGDGLVSAGDYASVQANYGNTGTPYYLLGDANADGMVSAGDYASVQANFGNTAASAAPVTPINTTPSESIGIEPEILTTKIMLSAVPVTIQTVEEASSAINLPALNINKFEALRPAVGFMSAVESQFIRPQAFNSSLTGSFVKSKIDLPRSMVLSRDFSRLYFSQKFDDSKLTVSSFPLVTSLFIGPAPALLSTDMVNQQEWDI